MHSRRSFPMLFLGLVVALAAVSFFRDPTSYLLPGLAYEDGRDMFAFFYNHREPGAILRFYNGYVSLIPNLAGYTVLRLPVVWVPYALAWLPLAFASLAFAWPYLPRYRALIPNDTLRLATCAVLALAPVGNGFFIANTTYSIWSLLVLLVWWSLAPPAEKPLAAGGRLVAMTLLIWSHPLSIGLAPVYLLDLIVHRRQRVATVFYAALTLVTFAYAVFGVQAREAAAPGLAAVVHRTAVFSLERVVFATTFSDAATQFLRRTGWEALIPLVALLLLAFLTARILRHRRRLDRTQRLGLAVLVYLMVAFTALYVIGRAPSLEILSTGRAFRYFWAQRLLWIGALAVAAPALAGAFRRPLRGQLGAFSAVLGVVYLSILNLSDNHHYSARARQGRGVAIFVAEVARQETTGDGTVDARLDRGIWSIELHREGRAREGSSQ